MAATRWLDVTHAILSGMRARPGYRAPTADAAGIPVFHSVEVGMQAESGASVPVLLVVGWAGDPSLPAESGQQSSNSATLGTAPRSRQEDGQIRGMVIAQTGDAVLSGADLTIVGTVPWLCRQAFDVLDDLDAFLRSTPTLGLAGAHVEAWVDSIGSVRPLLGERAGMVVELDWTVGYSARI